MFRDLKGDITLSRRRARFRFGDFHVPDGGKSSRHIQPVHMKAGTGRAEYARHSHSWGVGRRSLRIIMNFKFPNISGLSNRPSTFRKMRRPAHRPAPAGILSAPDLRRIVAEMLG